MKLLPFLSALLLAACVQTAPENGASVGSSSSSIHSSTPLRSVVTSSAASVQIVQRSSAPANASATPQPQHASANPLHVPFTVQAPFANWEDPYQEACEEASLLMVHHYLIGTPSLSAEKADADLLAVIHYEEQNGYGHDVTIAQLATVARNFYGHRAIVENNVTADRIERLLDEGNPVIVPAAGRELGNPYFSGEGPWYHMLVIIGYDRHSFFTNDPGTKRGAGYRYDKDVLLNAIHDWTGVKEKTSSGAKTMLVLRKN